MSWFEKLSGGVKLVSKAIVTHAKAVGTGMGIGTAAIAKPKETAVIVGAMAATAVVGPQALLQAGKALLPKTALGKLALGYGAYQGSALLIKSPKARETALDITKTVASTKPAETVSEIIESKTPVMTALEIGQQIIKEHPYMSSAALAAMVIAAVGHLPVGLGFLIGSQVGKGNGNGNLPPPQPEPKPQEEAPVTTGTELIKTPMASPSAPVQTPGVTAPIAIPSGVATKRRATRKTVAKRGYPSVISGRLNLKWRSGICQ